MKNNNTIIILIISTLAIFGTACIDEKYEYKELTSDEYPRILKEIPESTFLYWGDTMNIYPLFTPAFCEGVWTIGEEVVHTGSHYDFIMTPAYQKDEVVILKLTVENGQYSTFREIEITSNGERLN